jgi:hypothetical protein
METLKREQMNAITNMREPSKPLIYLAGKIAKDDWRHALLNSWRISGICNTEPDELDELFDPTFTVEHLTFRYGGPFFVSCDHGCLHGPASHGAAANGAQGCDLEGYDDIELRRRRIYEVNAARLRRATHVFAYIETADCYGTLLELGMAAALRKPIKVVFGDKLSDAQVRDMWMVAECAYPTPPSYGVSRAKLPLIWMQFPGQRLAA